MKIALLAALLSFTSGLRAAHCACGGEAFPGAALTAETLGIGAVALGLGVGYSFHEQLDAVEFGNRARRPGHGRFEGPDSIAAGSLSVGWGLSERLQVGISQSWQRFENYREAQVSAGGLGYFEHGNFGGLKDLDLTVKGRLLKGGWGALALQGGIFLPTGGSVQSPHSQVDASGNTVARPLPGWVQPGRGSLDGSLALAYSHDGESWLLDASFSRTIPSTTRGYRVGTRDTTALALGWKYRGHDSLYADFVWAQAESDQMDGRRVWATGGAFVGLGPRLSVSLNDRSQAAFQVMWPLLFGTAGDEGTRSIAQASARLTTLF